MGLYEDQLAKIQRTEDFLQRQIDLSDNNQSDVIEALLTNTWGTTNTFDIDGIITPLPATNLNEYLIQEGFDVDVNGSVIIPDYVDRSIWEPKTFDLTRFISSSIPEGSGTSLTQLQEMIDKMTGEMKTLNETTYLTNQRDLNPVQQDVSNDQCFGCNGESQDCGILSQCVRDTIQNDPLLNDEQKQSTLAVFGILLMLVAG